MGVSTGQLHPSAPRWMRLRRLAWARPARSLSHTARRSTSPLSALRSMRAARTPAATVEALASSSVIWMSPWVRSTKARARKVSPALTSHWPPSTTSSVTSTPARPTPARRSAQASGRPTSRPWVFQRAGVPSRRLQLAACHSMRASPGIGPVRRSAPGDTWSFRVGGAPAQSTARGCASCTVQVPLWCVDTERTCTVSIRAFQVSTPARPPWAADVMSNTCPPWPSLAWVLRCRAGIEPASVMRLSVRVQSSAACAPGAPSSRRGTASSACTWSCRPRSCQPPRQLAASVAEPRTVVRARSAGMPGQRATHALALAASVSARDSAPSPRVSPKLPASVAVAPGMFRLSRASPARPTVSKPRLPWSRASSVCASRLGKARARPSQRPWARSRFRRRPRATAGPACACTPVSSVSNTQACPSRRADSVPFSVAAARRESAPAGLMARNVARPFQPATGAPAPGDAVLTWPWAWICPPAAAASSDSMVHWVPAWRARAFRRDTGSWPRSHGPGSALASSSRACQPAPSGPTVAWPCSRVRGAWGHRAARSRPCQCAWALARGCGCHGFTVAVAVTCMACWLAVASWGTIRAATSSAASAPPRVPRSSAVAVRVTVWGLPGGVVISSPFSRTSSAIASVACTWPEKP